MCGVRKLTRATYANQRMTLGRKLRQSKDEAEYDDRATWAIHVACFHHSCFIKGVWRCLLSDVSAWGHATFFPRSAVCSDGWARRKEEYNQCSQK